MEKTFPKQNPELTISQLNVVLTLPSLFEQPFCRIAQIPLDAPFDRLLDILENGAGGDVARFNHGRRLNRLHR
jgi:hypothetical protein